MKRVGQIMKQGIMVRSTSVEGGWHVSMATQLSSFVIKTRLSTFVKGTQLQEVERESPGIAYGGEGHVVSLCDFFQQQARTSRNKRAAAKKLGTCKTPYAEKQKEKQGSEISKYWKTN